MAERLFDQNKYKLEKYVYGEYWSHILDWYFFHKYLYAQQKRITIISQMAT